MNKKIVIIGGGFGGLASAALLAKAGHEVTVLEKNVDLGGRARVWKENGFVFDMGPSWYLMPEAFERYFSLFNKKPSDFYHLQRLDPSYSVIFSDGDTCTVSTRLEDNKELFNRLEPDGYEHVLRFLRSAKYLYDTAMGKFIYRKYDKVSDLLDWQLISQGLRMHMTEGLESYVGRFIKSPKLHKLIEYTMVFLGSSPKNAPALYSIMAHIDFNLGVWYPMGGMGELVKALVQLGKEQGVNYHTDSEVTGFEYTGKKIIKVKTKNNLYTVDMVIGNADYQHMETKLLSSQYQSYSERYWQKKTIAPSMLILYLGIGKKLTNLTHHNLYLETDWDEHFGTVFDNPGWPKSYSYYLSCPSKTDPSVAPTGKENLFALVPLAPDLDDSNREQFADELISNIERHIGETFTDDLEVKRVFSHRDFTKDYNSYKGTALGLSHTLFQTALLRPHMQSKKVSNLYYVGQYTHPGVGVPMTLIAAEILTNLINKV